MGEIYRADPLGYLGTVHGPGILFPPKGTTTSALHAEVVAQAYLRIEDALVEPSSFEVYKEGANPALTIGMRAGAFYRGTTLVTVAAVPTFALTDDADNYIYLTDAGVLTKSVVGFPASAHIPLAEIAVGSESAAAASGSFAVLDIVDRRGRAMFSTVSSSASGRQFNVYEDFNAVSAATLPSPWSVDEHATGTADVMADEPGGVFQCALTAADAIEAAQLTWGNHRTIDTDNNPIVEFRVRIDGIADMEVDERIVIGLVADHTNAEDTLDNIDHSVWFLLKGAADLNIYMEADDGVTDTNDTDTTINLVDDTWTVFRIDMSDLTAVAMSVDGVAASATLDMTASVGQVLQPIICIQRDSTTGTEAVIAAECDLIDINVDR